MFQWLYSLFGTVLRFIYDNFGANFGVALILFTVFVKLLVLPLSIKQQRSMMRIQKLQPQLAELQRKYANDKDKLGRETMELYKKYDASPFGGCLPMIFQFIILIAMVRIVYQPATYIMGIADPNLGKDLSQQIVAAQNAGMNFSFLWWNLAEKPTFTFAPSFQQLLVWVLPVLATVATYFSGVISQKSTGTNQNANAQTEQAQQMTKSMTTTMPIITLIFTFTLPLSASLYWFVSTTTQIVQQILLTKFLKIDIQDEGGSYHDKHNKKRKKR